MVFVVVGEMVWVVLEVVGGVGLFSALVMWLMVLVVAGVLVLLVSVSSLPGSMSWPSERCRSGSGPIAVLEVVLGGVAVSVGG